MKTELAAFVKKNITVSLVIKLIIAGFLPVFICAVYAWNQGGSLSEIYFPNSEWNDEVFYYKQVEAIINNGFPKGYFGFNESHARLLSFAAWSPALYMPWALWGLIFGWSLMSPVIFNILALSILLIMYVCLLRPDFKQFGRVMLLFLLYTICARYMLSIVPEIICHCFASAVCILGMSYQEQESRTKLVLMFLISAYATLMRPYLFLFMLLPMYFAVKRNRKRGIIISGIAGLITVLTYALFSTEWLSAFREGGIGYGISNFFSTIHGKAGEYVIWIKRFFNEGISQGGYLIVYTFMSLLFTFECIYEILMMKGYLRLVKETEAASIKKRLPVRIHLALSYIAMFAAFILMYRFKEGSRHLLIFITAGIFVFSFFDDFFFRRLAVLGAVLAYVFIYKMNEPYEQKVPFRTEEAVEKLAYWEKTFAENITFDEGDVPGYSNTIIWTFSDVVDGKSTYGDWTILYSLPAGTGISCVEYSYLKENATEIKSRFIMMPKTGEIEGLMSGVGYEKLAENRTTVFYER